MFTRLDGKFPRLHLGPRAGGYDGQPPAVGAGRRPISFRRRNGGAEPKVLGAGNRERFDWWLNTFRCARGMARAGCARGALDAVMEQIQKQSNPQEQRRLARQVALPLREQMVQLLGEMYGCLLATFNHSSELGAVVNIEQQSLLRTQFLVAHDATGPATWASPC